MRIAVEAWSPEYSAGVDLGEPDEVSVEATRVDWEAWGPIRRSPLPPDVETVAFVDGTRRVDARVFLVDGDAAPAPGIAGTIGVGAIVCSAAGGEAVGEGLAPRIETEDITRYLALCSGRSHGLFAAPALDYLPMAVQGETLDLAVDALQARM
nr:hypothetical protein [Actinomycetota bacterium]